MPLNCSLQISLAPNDYRHAVLMLPTQIDTFLNQVDEIVLVLDTNRSRGRFGDHWEENLENIRHLLDTLTVKYPKVRATEVDYTPVTKQLVARYFFGTHFIPDKDYRGGPFYAYFYGLYSARSSYILHLDSDMFLGGQSQTWVAEAISYLQKDATLFTCSPHPGPPRADGKLIAQPDAVAAPGHNSYLFRTMSTRVFMYHSDSFASIKLKLRRPSLKNLLKALLKRKPAYELPEILFSDFMRSNDFRRLDFLGSGSGLWTLHPPYRTENFYNLLPGIMNDVKLNTLHPRQYGFYDIVDEICDWKDAEEKLKLHRWWQD